MTRVPVSAFEKTLGMLYFARMVDKIRLHAAGELPPDFQDNLGKGFDARCCNLLRVDYADLCKKVVGSPDPDNESLLRWCFAQGQELNEGDIWVWNEYLRKVGWNDGATELLARRKKEAGIEDRVDIQTMLDFFEIDEGRRS